MTSEQPESSVTQETPIPAKRTAKVFVGNFPNDKTEEEIKEIISTVGTVLRIRFIRNRRMPGYGFVTFSTPDEAEKAVDELNGKDVDGRFIKVEFSHPKKPRPKSARKSNKKQIEAPASANGVVEGDDVEEEDEVGPQDSASNIKGESAQASIVSPTEDTNNNKTDAKPQTARRSRGRGGRGRGRSGRGRRRGGNRDRTLTNDPSPTSLYVANLPYNLSDEGFEQVFSNFKVISAHVVRYKPSGASKGYGFVELENNEEQQRAIQEVRQVEINGRTLRVKVAMSKPYDPETDKQQIEEVKSEVVSEAKQE